MNNWNEAVKNLKSKYIPVGKIDLYDEMLEFWDKDKGAFYYPYMLINLQLLEKNRKQYGIGDDCYLLNDSGGFQVISGTCTFNWRESLERQLLIGSTKIFAFDRPPLIKKSETSNADFILMDYNTTKKCILENIEVALKQSEYLKQHHPERVKDFYYIMHGSSKELLDFNLKELEKRIGDLNENYKRHFGGVCYSVKIDSTDFIGLTTFALHAKEHFIKKELPVHFLGLGSIYRMMIMVRNEITTFDAATALSGVTYWNWLNNVNITKGSSFIGDLSKDNWHFKSNFCDCPVCMNVDYNKMIKEKPEKVGLYIFGHNVYQMAKMNIFLDNIKKEEYTKVVTTWCDIPNKLKQALEYCDYSDKNGFEIAFNKYKHYQNKDVTKQVGLF